MMRAASRFALRRTATVGSQALAPVAVGTLNVGLKTLAATSPVSVQASKPVQAAPASEASGTPVAAGKVSQIIGAVVDVQFGTFK